jgi:hypothetical protein
MSRATSPAEPTNHFLFFAQPVNFGGEAKLAYSPELFFEDGVSLLVEVSSVHGWGMEGLELFSLVECLIQA